MAATLEDLQHKVDILLHELVQLQETVEDLKQPIYETPDTSIYIGIKDWLLYPTPLWPAVGFIFCLLSVKI